MGHGMSWRRKVPHRPRCPQALTSAKALVMGCLLVLPELEISDGFCFCFSSRVRLLKHLAQAMGCRRARHGTVRDGFLLSEPAGFMSVGTPRHCARITTSGNPVTRLAGYSDKLLPRSCDTSSTISQSRHRGRLRLTRTIRERRWTPRGCHRTAAAYTPYNATTSLAPLRNSRTTMLFRNQLLLLIFVLPALGQTTTTEPPSTTTTTITKPSSSTTYPGNGLPFLQCGGLGYTLVKWASQSLHGH